MSDPRPPADDPRDIWPALPPADPAEDEAPLARAAAPADDLPLDAPDPDPGDPRLPWAAFLIGLAVLLLGFIWLALIAAPPGT